jgi:stage V sporulation protein K
MGNSDDEVVGGAPGSVAQQMQDDTEKALAELENIVGLEGVKKFIKSLRAQLLVEKERIAAGLPSSGGGVLHMVFAGNPGTGKTTVARIIANLLRALGVLRRGHLVEADRSSLVAGYSGQTALKTKAVVSEALGGVLFVDEAYALVSGDRDSFGKEALDTLMKEIEDHREDLVVIAAGYINEMKDLLASNPGMESRFPTTLHFADYNADELMSIAERVLEPQRITLGKGARETLHAHFSSELQARHPGAKGSNGRGVRNLLEAAKRAQALRLADVKGVKSLEDLTTLTKEDCELACRK